MHFHDEAEHDDVPFRFEGAPGRGHQIVVTAQKRQWLAGRWEHQWRRPPTGEELGRLVEDFVREEVLYREALARGLDLADLVVRRRLVQKMEVLAFADSAPLAGDAGVMGYFLAHHEDYRLPERVTFAHAFFSTAARGARAAADARAARTRLRRAGAADAAGVGDPPVAASPVTAATHRQVRDRFGAEFADSVFALEPGTWPARSARRTGSTWSWSPSTPRRGCLSWPRCPGGSPRTWMPSAGPGRSMRCTPGCGPGTRSSMRAAPARKITHPTNAPPRFRRRPEEAAT